jgi:hypothetical protein
LIPSERRKTVRWIESRITRDEVEEAGRQLCEAAGFDFDRDTAQFLADVVLRHDWVAVNSTTQRLLRRAGIAQVTDWAEDIVN